jgi:hypothetical protein
VGSPGSTLGSVLKEAGKGAIKGTIEQTAIYVQEQKGIDISHFAKAGTTLVAKLGQRRELEALKIGNQQAGASTLDPNAPRGSRRGKGSPSSSPKEKVPMGTKTKNSPIDRKTVYEKKGRK